ncbi:MAG: SDR family oxidoreductase [Pyrinomonas methylaliphatogenes]|nr:SDR family oxidoreductase [Pyrinomonas methylaliphatogenes]
MRDRTRAILLTGVGTIGRELLLALVRRTDYKIAIIIRPRARRTAEERAARVFDEIGLTAEERARVEVVAGDLTLDGLGLEPTVEARLIASTEIIIHTAAVTSLTADRALCESVNVNGTANLLVFAGRALGEGILRRVIHLSTVFVVGSGKRGVVKEDHLAPTPCHLNHYEWSKYEAERIVRATIGVGLPVTILRPSMVVGDTVTGWTRDFNVIYPLLRLMSNGWISRFPARPDARVHLAPIDFVVEATLRAMEADWAIGRTFHLTSPTPPTVEELLACDEFFPAGASRPRLCPPDQFEIAECPPRERELLESVAFCFPYFNLQLSFETANAARLMPLPVTDADYLRRLGRYAVESGYLRRIAA